MKLVVIKKYIIDMVRVLQDKTLIYCWWDLIMFKLFKKHIKNHKKCRKNKLKT